MKKHFTKAVFSILLLAGFQTAFSDPVGYVLLAPKDGNIYICKTGGKPDKVFTGAAYNSIAWSADAKFIYFMQNNSIWAMKNDGTGVHELCQGFDTNKNPLATFRPDPNFVLYMEGNKIYKIRYSDGRKTVIHTDTQIFKGEIGISNDGRRMVGRVDVNGGIYSYKITVGGRSRQYHNTCSPSISPNGEYLLYTVSDRHRAIGVVKWNGTFVKEINAGDRIIDASKFAVNSNEYIVNNHEQAPKVSIFTLSTGNYITVGNMPSEYPDFWVGERLPNPDEVNIVKIKSIKHILPERSFKTYIHGLEGIYTVRGAAFNPAGRYFGNYRSAQNFDIFKPTGKAQQIIIVQAKKNE